MKPRIEITRGAYRNCPAWEGLLSEAPVTHLVPEGIVSARTEREAANLRVSLAAVLEDKTSVVLTALVADWQIAVSRVVAEEAAREYARSQE